MSELVEIATKKEKDGGTFGVFAGSGRQVSRNFQIDHFTVISSLLLPLERKEGLWL